MDAPDINDIESITSFTPKSEITTTAQAGRWLAVWERKIRTLPKSAPKKMHKAYAAKVEEARAHLVKLLG